MQIQELIKILQSHPNPKALVSIVVNTVNIDDKEQDIECNHIEVFHQDDFYNDFVEIFATDKEPK